jgi:hypothetical protein
MEVMALILCSEYVGRFASSPVAEVKRTVTEIAYMSAVAIALRLDRVARSLMELFQTILCLRWLLAWYDDGLANQANGCARAIDALEEQLRLTNAPPPIGRCFSGHPPECGCERCLRGITKDGCDHRDRIVGVAQHAHGLFEPVPTQLVIR